MGRPRIGKDLTVHTIGLRVTKKEWNAMLAYTKARGIKMAQAIRSRLSDIFLLDTAK